MSAKRVDMGCRDLISNLPDEILGKILSLLWTNRVACTSVACTSVLSKRWRNLLALVDNLELNETSGNHRYFCDFVDRALALLSNSTTVKRFSLTCAFHYDDSRINSWIRTVLNRGLLELYLETDSMQCIDTEFFTSNKLVKLTICDGFYFDDGRLPPGGVFFPKLKTLSVLHVGFDYDSYELFISGCPMLEELFLHYDNDEGKPPLWNAIVSSPSVKRRTIFHHFPKHREAHDYCRFQTPSLVYLDYSSYVADQYEVDLGSLVEARLDLLSWERLRDKGGAEDDSVFDYAEYVFGDVTKDVTNLVAGISNVKTLHLSPDSLEVFYFRCKSMPVFHNLLTLSFESDKDRGWQVVPLLINNSPNLETLVIKGLVHQVTRRCGNACICVPKRQKKKKKRAEERVCCLSTCQVKVLNISAYQGTCRELKQMRHFLGNLKCLETVNVGVEVNHGEDNDVNNKYLKITDALMQLPKLSSNCRIHFF